MEERAKQKKRSQLVLDRYKYDRMESELRLAQQRVVLEVFRPLWVHLGILPEDNVHKRDETITNGALLQMANDAHDKIKQRHQAIWARQSQELKTWKAGQEMVEVRVSTLAGEELDRWTDMELWSSTEAEQIALDDAKFALWRASVNEGSSTLAQNPDGLLLEETSPVPAPVTNKDDTEENTPTPSPGSEEETASGGNLGGDATPGGDRPALPGLQIIGGIRTTSVGIEGGRKMNWTPPPSVGHRFDLCKCKLCRPGRRVAPIAERRQYR